MNLKTQRAQQSVYRRFFPFLDWITGYSGDYLRKDTVAGVTVAVVLVPQGMAYASLAGLPPIYGLYASLIPIFIYAFFGTSRQLSVGPVAISSILVLTAISTLADPGSPEFIGLAITTALLIGLIQVLLGVFRMGFLVNFLSHPIMTGFTSAAAVIIGVSQLKILLGIDIPRSIYVHKVIGSALAHLGEVSLPTLAFGLAGILVIVGLRRVNKYIPGALIAVILMTVIVTMFGLNDRGVSIVGEVPRGLPGFAIPAFGMQSVKELISLALTLTFIQMIESISIAKAIEARRKDHKVNANQELIALGLSKIGGAFFQAFPTTGSFSRSAINDQAGAVTGLSSVITGILVMLTLLFLTPLFTYMPKAVLASIIIVTVAGLVKVREARRLLKTHPWDFGMLLATFASTLLLGIMPGVMIGILLSLLHVIYRSSTPHVCELGRISGTQHYRNPKRFPHVLLDDNILIARFDAQLYFGNAKYFRDKMEELVHNKGDAVKLFVLNARSMAALDATAELALRDLIHFLEDKKIRFYLAGATGPMRDSLSSTGLMEHIGEDSQFMLVHDAIRHFKSDTDIDHWSKDALQTNISNT